MFMTKRNFGFCVIAERDLCAGKKYGPLPYRQPIFKVSIFAGG
jgi:hypothetical protein